MTINYTTLLGLAQPVTGTETGQWGDVVNDEITSLLEDAVANAASISVTSGDVTLTTTNGASNQARMSTLIITGSPGTTRNVIAPSQAKIYQVINQSDGAVVIKGSATTGVTIAAGATGTVVWNGSDFVEVNSTSSGRIIKGNLQVTGNLQVDGNTQLGNATSDTLAVTALVNSNLLFTDNTYDIGASGATRPRNLFLAGSATIGGNVTTVGRVIVDDTTDSSSTTTGSIQTDGGLGVAKALYVGTTANIGGEVTLSGGVANTVPFLNASKVLTTSSTALTWTGQVIGVGTTPNAWGSNWWGLQVYNGTSYVRSGGNSSHLINNAYNDNANWRYIGNAAASQIILGDGNITMSTAATGSTGNVATFSTGVYIDQLGKGIGLFGTGAAIPSGMAAMLALGDNDTGLAWQQDGVIHTYINNVQTISYNSSATIFNQYAGFGRSPSYIVDIAGNSRIMGATAFQDNILRMSQPSGTTGNVNQILFRDQGDTNTTASFTAYGSAFGSGLNNAVRIGNANGTVYLGQAGVWGVNTVPNTDWSTAYAIQLWDNAVIGSADAVRIQQNAYFSGALGGGAARLNATYTPSQYLQNGGNHVYYASSTGAAGSAITWNQQGILSNFGWNVGTRASLSWDSASIKAVQMGFDSATPGSIYQTQSGVLGVANNYYYNGGDIRAAAGYSTRYYQYAGEHFFQVAASSTAGSGITWSNAMAINRTGTLLATGDSASDGSIQGIQTGSGGFVERDYGYGAGSSRTIVVAGTYNYKIEITVMVIGNNASSQIGEGRWVAGRRDYSGSNHIYNSGNIVGSCVSFSTSQSTVGAQCTYTITVTNNQDGANNHWVVKVRLVNTDSFSIS